MRRSFRGDLALLASWRAALLADSSSAAHHSEMPSLEHVPEKWTRFSDEDMLPKFSNWREFFSIR